MRITETDALTLARHIRTKQLSPVTEVDAVLQRIGALQPTVNAFITVTADEARDTARSRTSCSPRASAPRWDRRPSWPASSTAT